MRTGRSPGEISDTMINVTETAASKISELLSEENKLGAGLRVFVQGGGCSGFQYGLMIDEGEGDASVDQVFEVQGVKLVRMPPKSARRAPPTFVLSESESVACTSTVRRTMRLRLR